MSHEITLCRLHLCQRTLGCRSVCEAIFGPALVPRPARLPRAGLCLGLRFLLELCFFDARLRLSPSKTQSPICSMWAFGLQIQCDYESRRRFFIASNPSVPSKDEKQTRYQVSFGRAVGVGQKQTAR